MQMTWIVRVAHAANGRSANKLLLAANTYFLRPQKKKKCTQEHTATTHTQRDNTHARCCLIIAKQLAGMIQ